MTINPDELFSRWGAHYQALQIPPESICHDGAGPAWDQQKVRALFVLKEAYDWDQTKGGDLRTFISGELSDIPGRSRPTWQVLAQWAYGLQENWPDFDQVKADLESRRPLRGIAAINLKKRCGGSTSSGSVIAAYALQDAELLREQLESLSPPPTVVVTCGTMEPFCRLMGIAIKDPKRPSFYGPWSAVVLPMRHPARLPGHQRHYNKLRDLWIEAKAISPADHTAEQ